jgi:hypothetical protein
MKLLLIDSRVEWQGLADARKADVDYLLFDFATASYSSLVASIAAKQVPYTDIALVQHKKQGEPVTITLSEGPAFTSPASLQYFLEGLKVATGGALTNFDFLGCRVFTEELRPVFEALEEATGVHLRASSTVTVIGFSTSTCAPASRKSRAIAKCSGVGVTTLTASTRPSNSR